MRTEEPKKHDPLVDMGYETRDVNYKSLGNVFIAFFLFTGISFGIGWVFWYFAYARPMASRVEAPRVLPEYPNPLLQTNVTAKSDMMTLRQRESSRLNGYGWVDEGRGIVHIPIDRAIELVAGNPDLIRTGNTDVEAVTRGNTTDQRVPVEPQTQQGNPTPTVP